MKNTIGVTSAAVLLTFIMAMGASTALHAKKLPKVDLCHFDGDTGLYKLKNVSMNAQKVHLRHGDGLPGEDNPEIGIVFDDECNPITAPAVLAHAFIEMGVPADRVYDPETDFTIARLDDTNGDGVPSAGDVVTMGYYPKNFNPTINDLGTYQVESHVVGVGGFSPNGVFVGVDRGRMEWFKSSAGEFYYEEDPSSSGRGSISDGLSNQSNSIIIIQGEGASNPDTEVLLSTQADSNDDPFIQVVFQ